MGVRANAPARRLSSRPYLKPCETRASSPSPAVLTPAVLTRGTTPGTPAVLTRDDPRNPRCADPGTTPGTPAVFSGIGRIGPGISPGSVQSANALRMTTRSRLCRQGRPPYFCAEPHVACSDTRPPPKIGRQAAARRYSERCCGMPASKARTSVSRYRRWPPRVLMDVNFPAFAHRVTVFGSTRNIVATSAGVSSGSASGVLADIMTASPPGPCLAILRPLCSWLHSEPALDVLYGLLLPYCHHQR